MSEEQQSISQILRAAREQRELDIDTVYLQTGISLPVLQGMENDRFDIIEPVFTRMALQSYAEYLQLEAEPLIARFNQEQGPIASDEPVAVRETPPETPGPRLPLDGTALRTIGLGVGALFVLILAISLFDGSDQPKAAQTPPPEPAPTTKPSSAQKKERPITSVAGEQPIAAPAAKTSESASTTAAQQDMPPEPVPLSPDATSAPPVEAQQVTPEVSLDQAGQARDTAPAPSATNANPDDEQMSPTRPASDAIINASAETQTAPVETQSPTPDQIAERNEPSPSASQPATTERSEPSASASQPVTTENSPEQPTTDPTQISAAGLPPSSVIVLEVEALDSTWVQIRWDGKRTFEGIVPRGERRRFEADDHFLVLSGRAHGLRYWLNDELLGGGQLGEATKVLRFRAENDGIEFMGPDFAPLTDEAATDRP